MIEETSGGSLFMFLSGARNLEGHEFISVELNAVGNGMLCFLFLYFSVKCCAL